LEQGDRTPDREEVMREAREYLDAREASREETPVQGGIYIGLGIFLIGLTFLIAGYAAEPPLKYALAIVGMLICVAAGPIAALGTQGHGPYGIWPIKSPREAVAFDAWVLTVGEKRFRIAVVIAVILFILILLLS
jgi:hypothetical protein